MKNTLVKLALKSLFLLVISPILGVAQFYQVAGRKAPEVFKEVKQNADYVLKEYKISEAGSPATICGAYEYYNVKEGITIWFYIEPISKVCVEVLVMIPRSKINSVINRVNNQGFVKVEDLMWYDYQLSSYIIIDDNTLKGLTNKFFYREKHSYDRP